MQACVRLLQYEDQLRQSGFYFEISARDGLASDSLCELLKHRARMTLGNLILQKAKTASDQTVARELKQSQLPRPIAQEE